MDIDRGSPGIVIGLSIIASEVFVAMVALIFIISVILHDFYRKKKIDTKDQIEMALKVSSVIFTTVVSSNEVYNILHPDSTEMSHFSPLFTMAIVYCMCTCSWLITLQCFFYFIKIVHFKWVFIAWAKKRISSIIFRQIVVVEVVSLCISLLHLLRYITAHDSSTNSSYISPSKKTLGQMIVNDVSLFLLILVFSLLALSTIGILLTTAFLRCHMNRMKDALSSGEAHQYKRVVRKMLRFLFLYFVFYTVMYFYYFSAFALYSVGYWVNLILALLFIPVVNILQILETPHWRSTWKKMTSYFTQHGEPSTH